MSEDDVLLKATLPWETVSRLYMKNPKGANSLKSKTSLVVGKLKPGQKLLVVGKSHRCIGFVEWMDGWMEAQIPPFYRTSPAFGGS